MDKDIIFKFEDKEINFTELFAIFFSLNYGVERLVIEDVNPIGIITVKIVTQDDKECTQKVITKIKQALNNVETIVFDNSMNTLQPTIGYNMKQVDDLLDEIENQIIDANTER